MRREGIARVDVKKGGWGTRTHRSSAYAPSPRRSSSFGRVVRRESPFPERRGNRSNRRITRPQCTHRTRYVFVTPLLLVSPPLKLTDHALEEDPANGEDVQYESAGVLGNAV